MKFYFIRHGQTTCNSTGVHQGWGPIRLSELGREQAINAREKVKNIEFDKYYCSDLMRTQQTAELIFPEIFHSGKFILNEDIREIDTGAYFGINPKELQKIYGEEYDRRRIKMDLGIYGMESSEHLKARVRHFKETLEAEANEAAVESALEREIKKSESQKMLGNLHKSAKYEIVTHGGVIRTFALLVLGLPEKMVDSLPAGALNLNISNCSVSIFDFKPGKGWSIDAIGI